MDEPRIAVNGLNTKDSQRECRRHNHSHSKQNGTRHRKVSVDEQQMPPSPIQEEVDAGDGNLDVIKLDDLKSEKSGSLPVSRKLDSRGSSRPASSRPTSVRSAFEHIPGTRPASRRVSTMIYSISVKKKYGFAK